MTAPHPQIPTRPDPTGLPLVPGVELRHSRGLDIDLPAMWAVSDAARRADGELERNTLEGMATYYRHLERFDPTTDLVIAEVAGRLVAYSRVEWHDTNDGERWYEAVGIVDPAFRRRGIGTLLLAWNERRRSEIAAAHAATAASQSEAAQTEAAQTEAAQTEAGEGRDRRRAFTTFVFDGDRGGAVLLEQADYVPFRTFNSMRRPDLQNISEAALPAGLEIRPVPAERTAMRRVFDAMVEAFRDHFGWTEGSDESFAAFVEDPDTDPALWVVAFDGDEIAGAVLNGIHVGADGGRAGWLDSVFTCRPWRQRGLARALITRSLMVLRDRGLADASLGVDTANTNEALRLYESCGFEAVSRSTAYRKPLPGDRRELGAGPEPRPATVAPEVPR